MCLQMILSFNKCRHALQTLILCSPLKACNACNVCFIQLDTISHGCQSLLVLIPGPRSRMEDLDEVARAHHRMPFSYVVCGLRPPLCRRIRQDRAQIPGWEYMPVRMPVCRPDPLEELVAKLDIGGMGKDERAMSSWRASDQSAVSALKEKSSGCGSRSPAFQRRQLHVQVNERALRHGHECPLTSSAKPSNPRSQQPGPGPAYTIHEEKVSEHSGKRPAVIFSTHRKQVSFASAAEVQYFEENRPPRAIKQASTGPGRDFALVKLAA